MSSPPNPGLMMQYAASYVNTKALEDDPQLAAFTAAYLKRKHDIDISVMALMAYAEEFNKVEESAPQIESSRIGAPENSMDMAHLANEFYKFCDSVSDSDFELYKKILFNKGGKYGKAPAIPYEFVKLFLWGQSKFRDSQINTKVKPWGRPSQIETPEAIKELAPILAAGASF